MVGVQWCSSNPDTDHARGVDHGLVSGLKKASARIIGLTISVDLPVLAIHGVR